VVVVEDMTAAVLLEARAAERVDAAPTHSPVPAVRRVKETKAAIEPQQGSQLVAAVARAVSEQMLRVPLVLAMVAQVSP
jgi:hypothetical protein